jgi:Ig-like domain CHU_C associated
MFQFLRQSAKIRNLFSKLGSLILLFQRSPLVQILFPEARILGGAGLGEITKWTIATVAGLGAYDTVAGATSIAQLAPNAGLATVAATSGSSLSFIFQCTGSPGIPKSWSVAGTLPAGLTHANATNNTVDSISGIPTQTGSFKVTVTAWRYAGQTGDSFSKAFTINVAAGAVTAPGITSQPASTTINSGGTTILTVTASGTSPTFQWYLGTSGVITNPVSGATSRSFTTPSLTATTTYWVRATNSAGSANSNAATVTVITPPAFTVQPSSITINSGGTTTLTVAASGTSPTFQWYAGASGNTANAISGATSASFTTPVLIATTDYWVQASNAAGTVNSNSATVNVRIPPFITLLPIPATVVSGNTATFTVAASGTSPTFQWYAGNSGVTTDPIAGATGLSFTTPALTATASYWVRATNAAGTADSGTVTARVIFPPVITSQPISTTIDTGETATFTTSASGEIPTFQWYSGISGDITNPILGATSVSFTTLSLAVSGNFWVRASTVAGMADSNTATVTVNDPLVTWKNNQFSAQNLANPLISGPSADPDGDGMTNTAEYIFGLVPLVAEPSPSPIVSVSGNQTSLRFTAKAASGPGYSGLTRHYAIETANSLDSTSWLPIAGYSDIAATDQLINFQASATGPHQFYRLNVWLKP